MAHSNWHIVPLADKAEAIPELADLFISEWEPYYGATGPGDAMADLSRCLNRHALPLAFVALGPKDDAIGTAALKERSVPSHAHLKPWLAALVVAPAARGRGVAGALAERIESAAKTLGFSCLYTAMSHAELRVLRRPGWESIDTAPTLRDPVTIYRLDLSAEC